MAYSEDDIIRALKDARTAKGLSQRALSARIGVPQSHLSKIENGRSDIRVSSLVEMARALDLDLRLVPRNAVPAVDAIIRSTLPMSATTSDQRAEAERTDAPRPAYRLDDDQED